MTRVYLSLGSNVGDRLATLKSAIRRLHGIEAVRFLDASPLYDAEPWESEPGQTVSEQRWFLNCVVAIETSLGPRARARRGSRPPWRPPPGSGPATTVERAAARPSPRSSPAGTRAPGSA